MSKKNVNFASFNFTFFMLRIIVRNLFFPIALLLLSSCVTIRSLPIETLQPARVNFEMPQKNISISVSPSLMAETEMFPEAVNADSLVANILFSLKNFLENMHTYQNIEILVSLDVPPNPDMLLLLDELRLNNTYYGQQYAFLEMEAFLHVHFTARWLIVNNLGQQINQFTDRDLMIWRSGIQSDRDAAINNLPDVKDAWWDTGITIAERFANRITPQWRRGSRHIYMFDDKFPELSQSAFIAMNNDAYWRALDIWENMLMSCRKKGQKKLKSRIIYNKAVAFEFLNQLEHAIYLAQQSVALKNEYRNSNYLRILKERQEHANILDTQMPQ